MVIDEESHVISKFGLKAAERLQSAVHGEGEQLRYLSCVAYLSNLLLYYNAKALEAEGVEWLHNRMNELILMYKKREI